MAESSLVVKIGADFSGLDKGIQDATRSVSSFGDVLKGTFVGNLASDAFSAAWSSITGSISEAFSALQEVDKLAGQTAAVIKSTGGAAGVTAEQISALADSLERKTGVEAESIQRGQNLLLTFTNIKNAAGAGNDIFNQTTRIMTDLGVAMGTDASGAAIQLGKALNDPTAGITALTRVGVSFTDAQKAQIKALQESGNIMGAQKIILAELNKEFGGSAEAVGKTFAGAVAKARNALGSITEAMLTPAVPAFTKALEGVANAAYAVSDAISKGDIKGAIDAAFGPGSKAMILGIAAGIGVALVTSMQKASAQAALMAAQYLKSAAAMAAANAPVLAAIAAISFAAYPFIKNWEEISGTFGALWGMMRNAAADALNRLGNYSANVWQIISGHFLGAYRSFVASFIGPVSRAFNALFDALPASIRDALGGLSFSMPNFNALPAGVHDAFQKVKEIARTGYYVVEETAKTSINNFKSTWGGLVPFVNSVTGSFSAATVDASKKASSALVEAGKTGETATKKIEEGHKKATKAAKEHVKITQEMRNETDQMARGFMALFTAGKSVSDMLTNIKWSKIDEQTKAYVKTLTEMEQPLKSGKKSIEELDAIAKYWGDTSDTTSEKMNILKKAIDDAVKLGIDPMNPKLAEARQHYDNLAASIAPAATAANNFQDRLGATTTAVGLLLGGLAALGGAESPLGFVKKTFEESIQVFNSVRTATDDVGKAFFTAKSATGELTSGLGSLGAELGIVGAFAAAMFKIVDPIVQSFGGWGQVLDAGILAFQSFGWMIAWIGENVIGATINAIGSSWTGLVNGIKTGVNFIIKGINIAIDGMNRLGGNIGRIQELEMSSYNAVQLDFTSGIANAMKQTIDRMGQNLRLAQPETKISAEAFKKIDIAEKQAAALGRTASLNSEKLNILQNALKDMIEKGISPANEAFKKIKSEIEMLESATKQQRAIDEWSKIERQVAAFGESAQTMAKRAEVVQARLNEMVEQGISPSAKEFVTLQERLQKLKMVTDEPKFNESYRGLIEGANQLLQQAMDRGDAEGIRRAQDEFQRAQAAAYQPVNVTVNGNFRGKWSREDAQDLGRLLVDTVKTAGVNV